MLRSTFPSFPRDCQGYQVLHLCATAPLSYRWCAGSSVTKTTQPTSLGARRVLREGKGKKEETTSRVQGGK